MKQCDNLAIASFAASESDPEDSFWRDFNFDFSFLTSDDNKSGLLVNGIDSKTVSKESELAAVIDSNVTMVEERSPPSAVDKGKEACSRNESTFSPLFTNTEVDSPCWKGSRSRNSSNFMRSSDDVNVLYGLNPLAPQFIPSNVKEFEGNGSSSLKRSLSSTFPPSSSGHFTITPPCKPMGILGITNQFQRPKKLDPLAPVFVPAYAVLHEESSVAAQKNAHSVSTYAYSEVNHIGGNPSNPRLGSQVQLSENTKLDSSSNKTHGSKKKLNPLAPQFSLADTKPKVYDLPSNVNRSVLFSPVGYRNHKELHAEPSFKEVDMGRHLSNILHGNSSPQMDVKKLLTTIHGLSELLTHVYGSEGTPNEQDLDLINSTVQNLNSYINNGVQGHTEKYGLTSLPNMCKQSIREHQIPKARNLNANVDFKRKEKYSMVSGNTGAEAPFEYGVTKENGFGQVVRNHQTGEQMNPQVLFYKSLWLKARADRSLMEYETYLSNSRT